MELIQDMSTICYEHGDMPNMKIGRGYGGDTAKIAYKYNYKCEICTYDIYVI